MRHFSKSDPVIALAFCIFLLGIATGFISGFDKWYSPQTADMVQTLALMQGHFALSDNPAYIQIDMLWHNGAVQQVWGLGVPILFLPFYIVANLFGFLTFPDRAIFLILLFSTALLLFYSFRDFFRNASVTHPQRGALLLACGFILFPPLYLLIKNNFSVYNETIAFLYICSGLLFALLVRFLNKKDSTTFYLLLFWAGFLPLVRPTGLFYALPAGCIALVIAFRHRWRLSRILLGIGLSLVGIVFLCATNYIRFGGIAEFGHSLNFYSGSEIIELTRFPNDFSRTPFLAKFIETAGILFIGDVNDTGNIFHTPDKNGVPFPVENARFRALSFHVFDLFYLLFLCTCIALPFIFRNTFRAQPHIPAFFFFGIFSLLSLLVFYSFAPFFASRYLVDFALSFFVLIAFVVSLFLIHFTQVQKKILPSVLCFTLVAWFIFEVAGPYTPPFRAKTTPSVTSDSRLLSVYRALPSRHIPLSYEVESVSPIRQRPFSTTAINTSAGEGFIPSKTNIPFNAVGWRYDTGKVSRAAMFFLANPHSLVLTLSTVGVSSEFLHANVKAKIGLEYLVLQSVTQDPEGIITVRFAGPTKPVYQSGIQVAFIDFTEHGSKSGNNIFLRKLTWE